jgi:hypothetical protein
MIAFQGVSAWAFQQLARSLDLAIPKGQPTKSPQNLEAAMRIVLKEASELEILQVMMTNLGKVHLAASTVLKPEYSAEVLDQSEQQEVVDQNAEEEVAKEQAVSEAAAATKYVQKRLAAARAAASAASAAGSTAASSSGSSSAGPKAAGKGKGRGKAKAKALAVPDKASSAAGPAGPVFRENLKGAWTKEDVLPFLPDQDSYRPVRDPRNGRWYMMHKYLGTSLSRSWTMHRSEARCVQIVLQWAWATEANLTAGAQSGQAICPHRWIFDECAELD